MKYIIKNQFNGVMGFAETRSEAIERIEALKKQYKTLKFHIEAR